MSSIIISDVFRMTPALVELAKELNAEMVVDPYNRKSMDFINESLAYNCYRHLQI